MPPARGSTASCGFVGADLEMVLPADFVDHATYPIVLDPLVGTKFSIWGGPSYVDAQPDCSYEKTERRYRRRVPTGILQR